MAKPRIFVSSTYYDLKHIRKSIESFIHDIGYEAVLFESGDIPFDHHEPLDESCYKELETCHILVLVIGGRYGSGSSDEQVELTPDELEKHYLHFNSITRKEYEAAKDRDIPIYIFIEKGVAAEYQTYRENRENSTIKYAHVDSVNIFRLLDVIYTQKRNNLVREFENVEDITKWLKDQWAGLFTQFLTKKSSDAPITSLEKQLANLNVVTKTLKDYSENIIQGLSPDSYNQIIETIDTKEKQRTNINTLMEHPFFAHLVKSHEGDPEIIFNAFSTSNNASEFSKKAKRAFEHEHGCGMLDDVEMLGVEFDFNELRSKLGLSLWENLDTKHNYRGKLRD